MKEDHRGIGEAQRGPHLVLLARDATRAGGACAGSSPGRTSPGPRRVPAVHPGAARRAHRGARRAVGLPRRGARAAAAGGRSRGSAGGRGALRGAVRRAAASRPSRAGFLLELQHHLLPDDDWLVAETARWPPSWACRWSSPTTSTTPQPDGRELQDVLTAIRHGRSLDTLADLRRPTASRTSRGPRSCSRCRRGSRRSSAPTRSPARAWREGIAATAEVAAACRSTSASSGTASRASRCPRARRRSATCPSCAGRGRVVATTR